MSVYLNVLQVSFYQFLHLSVVTLHGGSGGMANTIPLRPPEPFDFKKPDGWAKWKRRFEQFLSASGLDKEDETRQVSTLLYCLGEEAEGVLASTNISEEARKKYKDVMEKLDEHFRVHRNVIYEVYMALSVI